MHTKGPWKYDEESGVVYGGKDGLTSVCDTYSAKWRRWENIYPEMIENGHLIASAPELLEACEMALSCMAPEDNDVTARKLRSAISKAEGKL